MKAGWVNSAPSYFTTSKHDKHDYWISNIVYETKLESLDFKPSDECVAIDFFTPQQIMEINSFTNAKKLAEQLL